MNIFRAPNFEALDELFRKAQLGNKEAYGQFLTEIYPFVKGKIQQKLGSLIDSEDVTQECLIGIHRSMATYRPGSNLKFWVLGVIKHKVADYFRMLGRRKEVDMPENEISVTKSDYNTNSYTDENTQKRVLSAVNKLPDSQKRALFLTKISGLSYKEVSLKEGISETTLRKRVSRGYKLLRKEFSMDLEKSFDD